VYCSHDAEFAQGHFDRFTEQTGIPVVVKYDSEANKSLGLATLLMAEQGQPRADVFWNNQVSSTLDLQAAGVLEPYRGPGVERIPEQFRDPAGYWTGFAARLRVYIVNTSSLEPTPDAIAARMAGDLSRVAIAKPIFGTTRTHYTVLWQQLGEPGLKEWHRGALARKLVVARGNAHVKDLVAAGTCDLGWTDSDDFFVAQAAGAPVAMLPILVDGQALLIPNSVAIIKGTKRRAAAEKFVEFLLSAESELALARSAAKQIPLGPVDFSELPAEVQQLKIWSEPAFDMRLLEEATPACLRWLREEYLQ
jgi:iron(III) transport system substrate-binding protein